MIVYVGGKLGATPDVVALTICDAMKGTLGMYLLDSQIEYEGYPQVWTCRLDDGDQLHLTLSFIDHADKTHELYIEEFEITEEE